MERLGAIFAQNLKKSRRKCGLTQAQLAEKVEVSTHHIAMIELARHCPTFDLVERIANALNIEIYQLFVDSLSPREEMERLYQTVARDIERLVVEAIAKAHSSECKANGKA
jgi:DNA-binding XRE family transcriptional regulator